jgi:hypothetical protein
LKPGGLSEEDQGPGKSYEQCVSKGWALKKMNKMINRKALMKNSIKEKRLARNATLQKF